MIKKLLIILSVMALGLVASAATAQTGTPAWDPTTLVTSGKDSIVELLTSLGPVVFGALAVVIGWRFAIKLFKRLGRSI